MDIIKMFFESPITNCWMPKEQDRKVHAGTLIYDVCTFFHQNISDVMSKNRKKEFVVVRHLCMYLIRKKTDFNLKDIGSFFSNRDHSTVVYSILSAEFYMKQNVDINVWMIRIERGSNVKVKESAVLDVILNLIPYKKNIGSIVKKHRERTAAYSMPKIIRPMPETIKSENEDKTPIIHEPGVYSNHSHFRIAK